MRASKLMGPTAAAAAIVLFGGSSVLAQEVAQSASPWRDSEIDYDHFFSANALSKSAEPTYNPIYGHRLILYPQWHIGDYFVLRARLLIEQELTNADDTTMLHEIVLNDLFIDAATPGVMEPTTGIEFSGGVRFYLPTSKLSQANNMNVAIGPGLGVSRRFPLLAGLTISYSARFNFGIYGSRTRQLSSPSIPSCTPDDLNCGTNAGMMNWWGQLIHGPRLVFAPIPKLTIDVGYLFINSYLYSVTGGYYPGDENGTDVRYSQWFTASVGYEVLDFLTVNLGVSTFSGTLGLNGQYQTPFINRNTQISLGLALAIDPLVEAFR